MGKIAWALGLVLSAVMGAHGTTFSVPIHVTGLPREGEFVVLPVTIDFSELLRSVGVSTPVDERTLRLYRAGRRKEEIPYQFSAFAQERPRRRPLLGGSSEKVSYAAEYAVTNAPPDLNVAGELTWVASGGGKTEAKFLLEFATPESGRIVQTPFPPKNFRMFDEQGRATPVRWFPRMRLHPQWPKDGVVHFFDGSDLVTSYHLGHGAPGTDASVRRPYFYPVHGPEMIGLTEFGKPHDPTGSHVHHYSLWIAHHSVGGISFWAERGGVIAHESLELMEDGPIFARIVQRARWREMSKDILLEKRTISLYRAAANFRAMDLEMELRPGGSNAVTIGKTSFGFLAARVTQSMTVFDGGGEIRTAAGKRNESKVHLTRAEWLDQSGPIAQGKWGGIAILDSPENPNFPTGWHCRDDGWAGAAFNMEEPYSLEPGKALRLKYRVILHSGNADQANLRGRFSEWSARPQIKIGKVAALFRAERKEARP